MRLIDADKVIQRIYMLGMKGEDPDTLEKVIWEVEDLPLVDPVKHGRWIYQGKNVFYKCSECGYQIWEKLPYCGYCGAKMDEVTE